MEIIIPNHIEGKITETWLANAEGIFLNSGGKVTWPWLAKFSECFCAHSRRTFNGFLAVFVACEIDKLS